jgi:alpha-glucosidase (family GH31 glycosyl hydrolase)
MNEVQTFLLLQAAAFQPFFRAHAHIDTKRREPYLLPEENMRVVRNAIRMRYTFLPYWYTVFYNTYKDGGPVMQPLTRVVHFVIHGRQTTVECMGA